MSRLNTVLFVWGVALLQAGCSDRDANHPQAVGKGQGASSAVSTDANTEIRRREGELHRTARGISDGSSGQDESKRVPLPFDSVELDLDITIPAGVAARFGEEDGPWPPRVIVFDKPVHPLGHVRSVALDGYSIALRSTELRQGMLATNEFGEIECVLHGPSGKQMQLLVTNVQVRELVSWLSRRKQESERKMLAMAKAQEVEAARLGVPKELVFALSKWVKMNLVLIPAGAFTMGSPSKEAGRSDNEGPQDEVTISKPFYMGATEVTQAQYQAIVGGNPSKFSGGENPVDQVSWDDAMAFCRRLSEKTKRTVRLPTEAEWEYACRAGTTTRFSFGASDAGLSDHAWYSGNSDQQTHVVSKKKPNPWGLYDMHGNVWEWCADWYEPTYYRASPRTDSQGPGSGQSRVLRGGSWYDVPWGCRSAGRGKNSPDRRSYFIGFRAVVSAGVD